VWNRLEYVKDPDTGKRISRLNPADEWRVVQVPELRIVPQELWDEVKARQKALDAKLQDKRDPAMNRRSGIVATRRPQHLLSSLLRCGGGMSLVGGSSYGCSTARNKGTCRNRQTIRRRELEAMVLVGLQERLMEPDAVKDFIADFHRELNRLNTEKRAQHGSKQRERDKVEREIQALVEAVNRGAYSPALQRELSGLEGRHADLVRDAAMPAPPPVTIHPNAAEIYRRKVAELAAALAEPGTRSEAAEALRDLIDEIKITPEGDGNAVELVGELAALLHAGGSKNAASIKEAAHSGLLVAGRGFEPLTFRL
jgi:site-specific DNA recombinase